MAKPSFAEWAGSQVQLGKQQKRVYIVSSTLLRITNQIHEWLSPSVSLTASTGLTPSELRARLKRLTTLRLRWGFYATEEDLRLRGSVRKYRATLVLSLNPVLESDIPIKVKMGWQENEAGGSTVEAIIRAQGQGKLLILPFFVGGFVYFSYVAVTQGNFLAAILFWMMMAFILSKFLKPNTFPKHELHLAAEEVAKALDIDYMDLCRQNSAVLGSRSHYDPQ